MSTNQAPCGWNNTPTPASIGAATANHTHSPAAIGAANASHSHTAAAVGAAAASHTHSPAAIGAAAEHHWHSAACVGAAPAHHRHSPEEVGAAPAHHWHSAACVGAEPARAAASHAEADWGTSHEVRSWTPYMVRRAANTAIAAAGGGGGANLSANPVRIGPNAGAGFPVGSIAIGANAGQTGWVGLGGTLVHASQGSIAIGQRAIAGLEAIAIGQDSRAEGNSGNLSIGFGTRTRGSGNITLGSGSENAVNNDGAWGNVLIAKHGRNTHSSAGVISPRSSTTPTSRANNQLVLGTPEISTVGFSHWAHVSDARDKKEIQPLNYDPVAFVKGLQPKQFKYDMRQCYRHIEEITEDEYNALPEYEKQHRMITMPVFALKTNGDDGKEGEIIPGFEWIEEYAYLGIRPKSEDPTCFESCKGDIPIAKMTLADIPKFTTLNEFAETIEDTRVRAPKLRTTFHRDYNEALAAWKLSKCANPQELTPKEAALPLIDAYCYPTKALRNDEGKIVTDAEGNWVFAQDEDGNPTLVWPFPRKASEFDPGRVQVRTAYFHIVEDEPDGTYQGKRYHNGFVAQEVEELANSMGFDFAGVQYFGHHKDEEGVPLGDDAYALASEEMIAPIVAALQKALERIDVLEGQVYSKY